MKTNKKFQIWILSLILLLSLCSCNMSDFSYFPEDKSKTNDFIYKSGEIFYQAYFFPSDSSVTLTDYLNGNLIPANSNLVESSLQSVTYSDSDAIYDVTTFKALTNNNDLLKYTVATDDTDTTANKGIFVNFDPLQVLPNLQNSLVAYLWVINNGSTSATLTVNSCTVGGSCASTTDYTNSIPGGGSITSKTFSLVRFLLKWDSNNNCALVTLNTGTETSAYYDSTNSKLILQLTFLTVPEIKLSYYRIYIIKTRSNNQLKGVDNTCTNNKDCLPGYSCSSGTCTGSCKIECQRCSDTGTSDSTCQYCAPISKFYNVLSGTCQKVDYLDYSRITSMKIQAASKVSNTYTLNFWMFIEDNTQFSDNLINLTLQNFMMISIGIDTNKVVSYCNPYLNYYKNIETIVSKTAMDAIASNSKYSTIKNIWSSYTDGVWFYNRCSINLEGLSAYNLIGSEVVDAASNANLQTATLTMPNYYGNTAIDFLYHQSYTFNNGKIDLTIKNSETIGAAVFIKHLTVFTDFIPSSSNVQYFFWGNLSNSANFNSLYIYCDPLLDLTSKSFTGTVCRSYNTPSSVTNITPSYTSYSNSVTRNMPSTFYRLNLSNPNAFFTTSNLNPNQVGVLTCTSNSYCYKNSFQINCASQFYDYGNSACANSCPSNKMVQYGSMIDGVYNSGFCSFPCDTGNKAGVSCTVTPSNLMTSFDCKNTYSKAYFNCLSTTTDFTKGALHFGGIHRNTYINMPITGFSSTKYYVEFWYYVDKIWNNTGASTNPYIWLTNNVAIFRGNNFSLSNTYRIRDATGGNFGNTFTLNYGQWYKMAYNVDNTAVTFLLNNVAESTITGTLTSSSSIQFIRFCNGVTCSPLSGTVDWASGFYNSIRIWDATNIPLSLYRQFDRYWPFMTKMTRFYSLHRFFPLTIQYLSNKKILDPDKTPIDDVAPDDNSNIYQPWNFSINFDQTTSTNYINSFTSANDFLTPVNTACPSNCKTCNSNECLSCVDGYFLQTGACTNDSDQKYYLLTPLYQAGSTTTYLDITFDPVQNINDSFSCIFFFKFLGWTTSASSFDIFRYGTGLKLTYFIDTKTLKLTDGSNIFASVTSFDSFLGKWVNISLSQYYKSSIVAYYPPMMNFQVNFVNYPVSGAISGLYLNSMVIPKEVIAVFAKLWVSDKYIVGPWAEAGNKSGLFSSSFNSIKYIDTGTSSSNCLTNAAVDVVCVIEYDSVFLDLDSWCTDYSLVAKGGTNGCQTADPACKYGFYTTNNFCSCTSDNTITDNWIKNVSGDLKCSAQDYVDWGQTLTTTAASVNTGSDEYTLEFWTYIQSYVSTAYTSGFEVQWDKQLKILIKYSASASSYTSTCSAFYDSGDSSFENLNQETINIDNSSWVYLRCSVSKTLKLYFHFHETSVTSEKTLTGTGPTIPSTTSFKLVNNSINRGVVYFRQIRLWSCYLCQNPDTYKLEITSTTVALFSNLLHLWDPTYSSGAYPGTVTDLKNSNNLSPAVDSTWIGYNSLPAYTKLTTSNKLCVENVQAQSCSGLIKLNQIKDVKIDTQPARRGRYTIELWMMVSSLTNLTKGFHVIWKDLVSISFVKNASTSTTMDTYCWPQDYKLNLQTKFQGTNLSDLAANTINYDSDSKTSYIDGTWLNFRCAVSFNSEEFYFNAKTVKELKPEVLWKDQSTDRPWRKFFYSSEKSQLIIIGANLNSSVDIYIRQVYLFNDYLVQSLSFPYHDLTKINSTGFASLIFSISFFGYWKQLNKVQYNDNDTSNLTYNPVPLSGSLTYTNNLVVQTNCDPNGKLKYSSQTCSSITSCDLSALQANYCIEENTPLSCATDYFWDPDTASNNVSTSCQQPCTRLIRSPDSATSGGICNFLPRGVVSGISTFEQQTNLLNNFTCQAGFSRFGYKCLEEKLTETSYLYFNGCLKFPNISFDFPSGSGSILENGYTIQFWIRLDRLNEFCSYSSFTKYYFVAEPHTIYLETISTSFQNGQPIPNNFYNLVYQHADSPTMRGSLISFNSAEWNLVTIHVNLITRNMKVYSNNNFFSPDLSFENISSSINLSLGKLLWCSSLGSTTDGNYCSSYSFAKTMAWGAAFYKDIKIMDGVNANAWLAQASDSNLFKDNLSSFYYNFPMTVKSSLDYNMKNTLSSVGSISYSTRYSSLPNVFSREIDQLINYSSKSMYSENNPGKYSASIDPSTSIMTTGTCSQYCKKCVNNTPTGCIQCMDGSVAYANTCKRYTGYYLKLPLTKTSKTYLSLNPMDYKSIYYIEKENIMTFTVWIKYFGHLASTPCVVLFRLKSDGSRTICYNPSERTLNFYEGTKSLFRDPKVFNSMIGQWMLLSFSTFSDEQRVIPNLGNYFKSIYTFYVHTTEITKNKSFGTYPQSINFNSFDIGYEFSGLLADLRFYRNFILNPYGYIFGPKKESFAQYFSFSTTTNNNLCLTDANLNIPYYSNLKGNQNYVDILGISCVPDFIPYFEQTCGLNSFYDITKYTIKDPPCGACSNACLDVCSGSDSLNCTTDFNSGSQWLREYLNLDLLYGEKPIYTDFSQGSLQLNDIKVAEKGEYTMEFWFYIYSYNNTNIAFDSYEVIWDLHNYIKIYNNGQTTNNLSVRCSPVYDNRNRTIYIGTDSNSNSGVQNYGSDEIYINVNTTSVSQSIGGFYRWSYVQCSTSVPRKIYYLNNNKIEKIQYPNENIPNLRNVTSTSLITKPGDFAKTNFGFLFIREMKLWSQYDVRMFTTQCRRTFASLTYYPNLLHYFENNYNGQTIKDLLDVRISGGIVKSKDFIGYNKITLVTNQELIFPLLEECGTMNVNPTTGMVNVTTFNFQSTELQQSPTNTYKFSYRVKDSEDLVTLSNYVNNREVTSLFKFPSSLLGAQVGSEPNTILVDVYCEINYSINSLTSNYKKMTVYKRLELQGEVSFSNNLNYNTILSTMDFNTQLTNLQVLDRVKVLKDLQSDLKVFNLGALPIISFNNSTNSTTNNLVNGREVLKMRPTCENFPDQCNSRGFCYSYDLNLFCECFIGYTGDNCQLRLSNYITWSNAQQKIMNMFDYRFSNSSSLAADAYLVESLSTLLGSSSNFVSSSTQIKTLQKIVNSVADYPLTFDYFQGDSKKNNFFDIGETIFKLNLKTINLQKYKNFKSQVLSSAESVKNSSYSVKYYDLESRTEIYTNSNKLMRNLQLNSSLANNPLVVVTLEVKDPSQLSLNQIQIDSFSQSSTMLRNYFEKISLKIFAASLSQNQDLDYTYNSQSLNLVLKKISNVLSFNYKEYFTKKKENFYSYFDATECMKEFANSKEKFNYDISTIFFYFMEYKILDKTYNKTLAENAITTSHELVIYDINLKLINLTCSSGIVHYLPLKIYNDNGFLTNYNIYPSKYSSAGKTETGMQYYPAFIFPNGTIDHSPLSTQRAKYYRNYNISVLYFNQTLNDYSPLGLHYLSIEEDGYVIAKSTHLSQFQGFAYYTPINNQVKNHYFYKFQNIFVCADNVRNNMCFYIVIFLFAFHFITLAAILGLNIWKKCKKMENHNLQADLVKWWADNCRVQDLRNDFFPTKKTEIKLELSNIHNEEEANLDIAPQIPHIEANQADPLVQSDSKKLELKDGDHEEGGVRIPSELVLKSKPLMPVKTNENANLFEEEFTSNKKFYNFLHFIIFRNIYSNIFCFGSPLMPKYKSFSKLIFLVCMLMLIISVLVNFMDIDLILWNNVNKSKIVGFLFISVFASNLVLIGLSSVFNTKDETKKNLIVTEDEKEKLKLLSNVFWMNVIQTVLMNLLTLSSEALLYYFSVGFCAVWSDWAHNLLITWLLAIILDFLVMEFVLELLILFTYIFRKSCTIFADLYRLLLFIKKLRS